MERTRSHSTRRRRGGFTLLELLIVLAILGVIAAMVAPSLLGTQQKSMIKAAGVDISTIEMAAKRYAVDHDGEFPEGNDDVLKALVNPPADKTGKMPSPYLEKLPVDPWGQQYHYEFPTTKHSIAKPAIWSSGPKKANDNGGNDDIKNWD